MVQDPFLPPRGPRIGCCVLSARNLIRSGAPAHGVDSALHEQPPLYGCNRWGCARGILQADVGALKACRSVSRESARAKIATTLLVIVALLVNEKDQ